MDEHIVVDEVLHGITRRLTASQKGQVFHCVMLHYEVSTVTDIDHPADSSDKHGDGRLVHTRQMSCGNHHIAQQQKYYDNQCHTIDPLFL